MLVVNAMGRIFMDPLDDPFAAVEREIDACPLKQSADAIIVDIHAEATSEKQAMGHFCDGRASLVIGTHTHVPTADHQILPRGTAFMSDVGMTGDYNSVIGMDKEEPMIAVPAQDFRRALRAGERPGDIVRRLRSRPMTPPAWRGASRPCAWAAGWKKRGRHSGNETLACACRDRSSVNSPALWTSLVAGGQPSAPKSHKDIGSGRHGQTCRYRGVVC